MRWWWGQLQQGTSPDLFLAFSPDQEEEEDLLGPLPSDSGWQAPRLGAAWRPVSAGQAATTKMVRVFSLSPRHSSQALYERAGG